jgi:hypothetical protein
MELLALLPSLIDVDCSGREFSLDVLVVVDEATRGPM